MKLKWEDKGIKSPLARARGLGSARDGVEHWWMQRVTAIANIPLVIWFVYSIVHLKGSSHAEFVTWMGEPLNAILSILFVVSVFKHAKLGNEVFVEDYFHNEGFKLIKMIGLKLFYVAAGIACIFSILKIAFMG